MMTSFAAQKISQAEDTTTEDREDALHPADAQEVMYFVSLRRFSRKLAVGGPFTKCASSQATCSSCGSSFSGAPVAESKWASRDPGLKRREPSGRESRVR